MQHEAARQINSVRQQHRAAAVSGASVERFVDGFEAGALAMDSYRFGPR